LLTNGGGKPSDVDAFANKAQSTIAKGWALGRDERRDAEGEMRGSSKIYRDWLQYVFRKKLKENEPYRILQIDNNNKINHSLCDFRATIMSLPTCGMNDAEIGKQGQSNSNHSKIHP
jgi:hypothetical protein